MIRTVRQLFWELVSWIAHLRQRGLSRTVVMAVERKAYPIATVNVPIQGAGRRDAHLRRVISHMHTCIGPKPLTPCLACRCLEIINGIDRQLDEEELKKGALRRADEVERVRIRA